VGAIVSGRHVVDSIVVSAQLRWLYTTREGMTADSRVKCREELTLREACDCRAFVLS
jgi:hypothetical protein